MHEQRIKGVYQNSKHRVRGNQAAINYYYKEKTGLGFNETQCWASVQLQVQWVGIDAQIPQVSGLAKNHQGREGCLDA